MSANARGADEDVVEAAWASLRLISDPCSVGLGKPIDIVSLGLVEAIVEDHGRVTVSLVLTQPACYFFLDIRTYIVEQLSLVPGISDVVVEVADELWVPSRMDNAGRPLLSMSSDGPRPH